MLFHSKHGSIFAKHVIKRGLPEKKLPVGDKKRVYPSGFSGKRAAKTGKLYALKAESDMDAIRAYHTMSANLASVEELSLSLMSFVEETTASAEMLEDHAQFNLESMPPEMDTNINVAHNDRQEPHLSDGLVGGKLEGEESWQWKPNHYSDVGAFGMTLPIADKGGVRATLEAMLAVAISPGHRAVLSFCMQVRMVVCTTFVVPAMQRRAFRFIMLASQGSGVGKNNRNSSSQDKDPARSQAQSASFCPATPHGRRIFREREKALQEQRDRILKEEKMEDMLQNAKPFKGLALRKV